MKIESSIQWSLLKYLLLCGFYHQDCKLDELSLLRRLIRPFGFGRFAFRLSTRIMSKEVGKARVSRRKQFAYIPDMSPSRALFYLLFLPNSWPSLVGARIDMKKMPRVMMMAGLPAFRWIQVCLTNNQDSYVLSWPTSQRRFRVKTGNIYHIQQSWESLLPPKSTTFFLLAGCALAFACLLTRVYTTVLLL